jgi:16S rRNA (guanine966-N2)-methyltransferase
VRVVAGTFKGQRLEVPKRATRPTADRVKEALFSMLGPVEGLRVLDLFAGSGALGIEALSRGAASATFVDSDGAAISAVRSNVERLGVEHARVVRADALAFLRGAAWRREHWDLALCDPPYRLAHRLGEPLGRLLVRVLAPGARVVCESSSRHPLDLPFAVVTERRYGDTRVAIYARPDST